MIAIYDPSLDERRGLDPRTKNGTMDRVDRSPQERALSERASRIHRFEPPRYASPTPHPPPLVRSGGGAGGRVRGSAWGTGNADVRYFGRRETPQQSAADGMVIIVRLAFSRHAVHIDLGSGETTR